MNNTYLDRDATISRIRNMETQSDTVRQTLEETRDIMNELSRNFEGVSATNLQNSYQQVADTFIDLRNYFQKKINELDVLTTNITATDER